MKPLFSIGITTYKRKDLLKQCLMSILDQNFDDIEIIVGNDYQAEPLDAKLIGVEDKKVRYVNYPKNIGEFANLNKLLELANGKYFSWFADDDLMFPGYFHAFTQCIEKYKELNCAFSAFEFINGSEEAHKIAPESIECHSYSGQTFLRLALQRKIWPIVTMGIFKRDYLIKNGGFPDVTGQSNTIGLYGEYMLLLKTGLEHTVLFVPQPVVGFRLHGDSWSTNNNDSKFIKKVNINFFAAAVEQLKKTELADDFRKNIRQIFELCLYNLGISMLRSKYGIIRIIKNLAGSYSDFNSNDNLRIPFAKAFCRISINMIWTKLKRIIKRES